MNNLRDWESHDETLSVLYRTTHDVEPPAWLDERILTAAHLAVAPPQPTPAIPHSRRRSVRFWAVPVALAATVIMTVGIVQLVHETDEWNPPIEIEMKAQSVAEPPAKTDAVSSGRRESVSAKQRQSPALPSPVSVPPPVAPATHMMKIAPSSTAPPMPQPWSSAPEERRRSDHLKTAPVMRDEDTRNQQQQDNRSPEEWLADIAELRRQGRIAEAEASLAKFRRRYSDYRQPIWEGTY